MLQEVCGPGQYRRLRRALYDRGRKVNGYWVPQLTRDGKLHSCGQGQSEGVAMFTRTKYKMRLRSAKIFKGSGGPGDFRRVIQAANMDVGSREIRVYNTHLSHINDTWRARQISAVGRIASEHPGTELVGETGT